MSGHAGGGLCSGRAIRRSREISEKDSRVPGRRIEPDAARAHSSTAQALRGQAAMTLSVDNACWQGADATLAPANFPFLMQVKPSNDQRRMCTFQIILFIAILSGIGSTDDD